MTASDEITLSGRCLCGAVEIAVRPETAELHACHCEMCRRWTGSAFVEVDVRPDDLTVSGPVRSHASSDWAERAWCDTCDSTLWYRLTLEGHERYAVSAGLFDDAGGLSLAKEIFIDAKPGGYAFAGARETKTRAEMEAIFASLSEGAA
ncbi:hypothetical protein LX81_03817 [Palleronia aestuarii]|uniref:CENP-V/GFA domain-containing protein n=1 Tax=Palleronia aestuarii TaxID=568105 RepID=A0A2W7MV38_9RHOB|nr:GFA family protein [Palleronia aestuarii]PZX11848.1 hypothetical protein LX81_03817 [Palleronia aestuarii]